MKTAHLPRLAGLAAAFTVCAMLQACSRTEATPAPVAKVPPATASVHAIPVRSEAWKLDRLITCYNEADEPAHGAIAGYLAWIASADSGPSGREQHIGGIRELPAALVDRCSDQLHMAHTEGPALRELDGAARSYLASLRDLSMQILPLHRYYAGQAWQDDGFARGKALHGKLMESARQFAQASERFAAVLERENEHHLLAQMAELQEGGPRGAGYYRLALVFDGRRLVRLLEHDTFSPAEARRRIAAFERIAASAGAARRPDGSPVRELRQVSDRAGVFLAAAKVRAGAAPRTGDGGRDHLLQAYNELVEGVNGSK